MPPAELERYLAKVGDPDKRAVKRQVIQQGAEAPQVVGALHRFQKVLEEIDARLAESPWLCGETYSLADAAYTPYLFRLETMQMGELWEDNLPNVRDWYHRIRERFSFHEGVIAPAIESNLNLLREGGSLEWPKLREKLLPRHVARTV
jgi:glutathione S-transferase